MKALSLHQPWASLIAIGAKRIETRHWTTSYRGPLAIHAAGRQPPHGWTLGDWRTYAGDGAATLDPKGARMYRRDLGWATRPETPVPLPLGAVVATCDLVDVVPIGSVDFAPRLPHVQPSRHADTLLLCRPTTSHCGGGEVSGTFDSWESENITDQRAYGDFTPGRFAWLLENIEALPVPVPAKGRQGLWNWEYTTP